MNFPVGYTVNGYLNIHDTRHLCLNRMAGRGRGMRRQKLGMQNSWQLVEHAKLHSLVEHAKLHSG